MAIRVLVNGAFGRMGQLAVAAINDASDLELVGQCGRDDDLASCIQSCQADVVVDLTLASAVFQNAQTIINAGAHPVIGTSGLTAEQVTKLQALCADKQLGGIIAPNFGLGAVLMMKYAQDAAKYFNDVEIVERHHPQKQDKPSGTARKTAQMIAEHTGVEPEIHSVRLPGIIAEQSVTFGKPGETLTITDVCNDRKALMPGLLLCIRNVTALQQLIYGLEHLL